MTFQEWWKDYIKEFGALNLVYEAEVKYHAEQAWNKAVNEMMKPKEKSQTMGQGEEATLRADDIAQTNFSYE